jgi:hypothetical protein
VGFQDAFRFSVEFEFERAFEEVGFKADVHCILIGFEVTDGHRFPICVEQGEGLYDPEDFSVVQRLPKAAEPTPGHRGVHHPTNRRLPRGPAGPVPERGGDRSVGPGPRGRAARDALARRLEPVEKVVTHCAGGGLNCSEHVGSRSAWRWAMGRYRTGRAVQVMRVPRLVKETLHGSPCRSASVMVWRPS